MIVPGAAFIGGSDHCVTLINYRPPQAGQPPASKVLSRHGLLSQVGAWGLGQNLNGSFPNIHQATRRELQ